MGFVASVCQPSTYEFQPHSRRHLLTRQNDREAPPYEIEWNFVGLLVLMLQMKVGVL